MAVNVPKCWGKSSVGNTSGFWTPNRFKMLVVCLLNEQVALMDEEWMAVAALSRQE